MGQPAIAVKCVVVGDGGVGKSSMLDSYVENRFPLDPPGPTVLYPVTMTREAADGKRVQLALWDTDGGKDYPRLRPLSYPQSDVIMLCFSVVGRWSFNNIPTKWCSEVEYHLPDVRRIVVGTKTDLRTDKEILDRLRDKNETPVTTDEGRAMAQRLGADSYRECSALTQEGLKGIFDEVIAVVLHPNQLIDPNQSIDPNQPDSSRSSKSRLLRWLCA